MALDQPSPRGIFKVGLGHLTTEQDWCSGGRIVTRTYLKIA